MSHNAKIHVREMHMRRRHWRMTMYGRMEELSLLCEALKQAGNSKQNFCLDAWLSISTCIILCIREESYNTKTKWTCSNAEKHHNQQTEYVLMVLFQVFQQMKRLA